MMKSNQYIFKNNAIMILFQAFEAASKMSLNV